MSTYATILVLPTATISKLGRSLQRDSLSSSKTIGMQTGAAPGSSRPFPAFRALLCFQQQHLGLVAKDWSEPEIQL